MVLAFERLKFCVRITQQIITGNSHKRTFVFNTAIPPKLRVKKEMGAHHVFGNWLDFFIVVLPLSSNVSTHQVFSI